MKALSKTEARRIVKSRLHSVSYDEYASTSTIILERVRLMLSKKQKSGLQISALSYQAMPDWCEIDLTPLELSLPDCKFEYTKTAPRASKPAGIYDIILVPLYGFSRGGFRLGRGGGWYDQFLVTQPQALTIGVGLEAGSIDFRHEKHDIPMDIIITESQQQTILR